MKPREFWIVDAGGKYQDFCYRHNPFPNGGRAEAIHVREVVPIDWAKVWGNDEYVRSTNYKVEQIIEQLVEKQLRGEE